MSDNFILHKEFGLNPTMPICIICRKEKGAIALLGAGYKGEAPMHMLMDIEPCGACKEKYLKSGTLLVECETDGVPTGAITVLKDSAFEAVFQQRVPVGKIIKVEVGILQMLEEQINKSHV
jgi:hypothetical protein